MYVQYDIFFCYPVPILQFVFEMAVLALKFVGIPGRR